jgi:hypothetical protein
MLPQCLLLSLAKDSVSNTIKILLSHTSHSTSTILTRLADLHLLKLNEDTTNNPRIRLLKMLRSDSIAECPSVPLSQGTDSDTGTEVDLARDGCGADVVPVVAVGCEFLPGSGFDEIGPDGELEFVGVLQVLGVCLDELIGSYVTYTDSTFFLSHFDIFTVGREMEGRE